MAAMPQKTETKTEPAANETGPDESDSGLIEEELVVEEISIDGMCGVY